MQSILAPIHFGKRVIIFFVFLEALTVPLVAISNGISTKNIIYSAIVGFVVAFICVLFLVRILKNLIIMHSENLFGIKISNIQGVFYIGLIAGILLMIMFAVQFSMFQRGYDDFSTGFVSAFISVIGSLILYNVMTKLSGIGITLTTPDATHYQIYFAMREIIYLSIIFGIYELIVCPITGAWLHFTTYRLPIAILSGALGGTCGGFFLYLISNLFKIKLNLHLNKI